MNQTEENNTNNEEVSNEDIILVEKDWAESYTLPSEQKNYEDHQSDSEESKKATSPTTPSPGRLPPTPPTTAHKKGAPQIGTFNKHRRRDSKKK